MLTSPSNPRIKNIRKLKNRKERERSGLFYLEGLRIVGEAFQQHAELEELIVAPGLLKSGFGLELVEKARESSLPVIEVSETLFEKISVKERPQGIAAVGRQKWYSLEQIGESGDSFWVALDAAQDPGNIGTILRSADAVGSQGIILLDESSDPYSPAAIRASMGAVFSQKLVKTGFEAFAEWKKSANIKVVGTSGYSTLDYQALDYPQNLILLMGSERQGLLDKHLALCDEVVSIPMVGRSDSLNLAVATAVVLYEVFNQRRNKGGEKE